MAVLAAIVGRLCIAVLFVMAGVGKLMDPAGTSQYITSVTSLAGNLAVPVGVFELVAGLLLGLGVMTRLVSLALIGFTALATLWFHNQVTDPTQATMALKNLAIIGGLLMVFAYGQVSWRISTWRERDRRHDAEVAAARAETRAEMLEKTGAPVAAERRGLFSGRSRTVADKMDGNPLT